MEWSEVEENAQSTMAQIHVRRSCVDAEEYPCDSCDQADFCDGWEAQFCCTLCQWSGYDDCENCDPYDI